jgi:hypothetical protein
LLLGLVVACGSSDALVAVDGATSQEGGAPASDSGMRSDVDSAADAGGEGADVGTSHTTPTVVSAVPADGAADVAINANATVTFSEPMDSSSLSATTFTVTNGTVPVPGKVIYASSKAVFWPAAHLDVDTVYTATISTAAQSAYGVALATKYSWSFTTGTGSAPGMPVNLGTAGTYVILTKSGISNVPTSFITGDIGVSPAAAGSITGFPLAPDANNVLSTTPEVTGNVYAADYALPTPTNLTAAVADMQTAFTDGAARAPDVTELGAGDISGLMLVPGVYSWSSSVLVTSDVTLSGSATDVWIFQIAQTLTMSSDTKIVLTGGALPKNVFWQVSGLVDLVTGAHLEGIVLAQTAITLGTATSINGRLLAQTAVTIAGSTIVQPAP